MRLGTGLLIAGSAVLFATSMAGATPTTITTQTTFLSAVQGKTLSAGKKNSLQIETAGTIQGTLHGSAITASKWAWQGTQFCSSLSTAQKSIPWRCVPVTLDGTTITFGKKPHFRIN